MAASGGNHAFHRNKALPRQYVIEFPPLAARAKVGDSNSIACIDTHLRLVSFRNEIVPVRSRSQAMGQQRSLRKKANGCRQNERAALRRRVDFNDRISVQLLSPLSAILSSF